MRKLPSSDEINEESRALIKQRVYLYLSVEPGPREGEAREEHRRDALQHVEAKEGRERRGAEEHAEQDAEADELGLRRRIEARLSRCFFFDAPLHGHRL